MVGQALFACLSVHLAVFVFLACNGEANALLRAECNPAPKKKKKNESTDGAAEDGGAPATGGATE
jgi:hypothetical protein